MGQGSGGAHLGKGNCMTLLISKQSHPQYIDVFLLVLHLNAHTLKIFLFVLDAWPGWLTGISGKSLYPYLSVLFYTTNSLYDVFFVL